MAHEKGKPGDKEFQLEVQVNGEKEPRSLQTQMVEEVASTMRDCDEY
jgi:hypothetical protein